MQTDPDLPMRHQPFTLELRSHVAGAATLIECASPVGRIDLDVAEELDRLYDLQREISIVRICAEHDLKTGLYEVSIRNDRLFHLDTSQPEEIEDLVRRTVEAADVIEAEMMGGDAGPAPWLERNRTRPDAKD